MNWLWSWIPRTGGTSIHNRLHGAGLPVVKRHGLETVNVPNGTVYCLGHLPVDMARTKHPKLPLCQSFCVVRNPWDRLVSIYEYSNTRQDFTYTFREFICELVRHPHKTAIGKIRREGVVIGWPQTRWWRYCDRVLLFERLQCEWDALSKVLGRDASALTRYNESDRAAYQEYYDGFTRDIVATYERETIDAFEYKF
jgi:hypothetical protein